MLNIDVFIITYNIFGQQHPQTSNTVEHTFKLGGQMWCAERFRIRIPLKIHDNCNQFVFNVFTSSRNRRTFKLPSW